MPARVLVPVDDSEPAREALEYAMDLFPDGEFVALTVVDSASMPAIPNTADDADEEPPVATAVGDVEDRLSVPERLADERGVALETRTRVGSPAREIVEFAETEAIDHVVIGSRGRSGVKRLLLGSVAETVVRHSPVPVTVVR